MSIPIKTIWLPRPANNYRGCYPLHFERHLKELLDTENYIHLFSGHATSGHTVDINPDCNPKTIANAECLPFEDNSFDGGFADPPYNRKFARELYGLPYPIWNKWTKELVRVVRPSSKIGIMQNYIVPRLVGCEYDNILVILLRIKQFPKIVTIQHKVK